VETLLAFVTGGMAAASVYMLLSRHVVRMLLGLILLSNTANLLIFFSGRPGSTLSPLVPEGLGAPTGPVANPVPQALILTAIVISFGLLAFALVLVYRGYLELGTVDSDRMRVAEPPLPGQVIPPPEESGEGRGGCR
jgi:multicomponent Na+:H+ antiporter subunit C